MLADVLSEARSFDAARVLSTLSQQIGVEYVVNGEPEPAIGVYASDALMPVVALYAQSQAKSFLGVDLGFELVRSETSLLGVHSRIPRINADGMGCLRLCFLEQAARRVFGIEPNVQVELAPVIERFLSEQSQSQFGMPMARVSR